MKDKYINKARDIVLDFIDKDTVTVFLFGSRTDENFSYGSDIDIGFLSSNKLDDKLFIKINEALEKSIIPYHIDLVDFNSANNNFKEIALKKIEIWNKAKDSNIN
jgi:predicted nucleotidyltransferase